MRKMSATPFNLAHFSKCILTLELSLKHLQDADPQSVDYEVFRNATVKGFELTLETAGKLLRRALKNYVASPKEIDAMTFKDVLRQAAKHGLMEPASVERWFRYRDNRNDTAHDYGEVFAKTTLKLMPQFVQDVKTLAQTFNMRQDSAC